MPKIKLKPCPFCGSDDIKLWHSLVTVGGRCNTCGADSGYKADGGTNQDAINAWNRRFPEKETPPKEERRGKWETRVYHDEGDFYIHFCSVCGLSGTYKSKYCPNCGAKMDGKQGDK